MGLKIWLNTGLVDEADAKISVFDHGLLYGDGVFEGIRVYSRRVFELDAHIKRLYESARAIRLTMPMTKEELTDGRRDDRQGQRDRGRLHPARGHPRRGHAWA